MKKMTRWMVLGLCLLLPACALGVTEGTVEDAPMVTLDGMSPAKEQLARAFEPFYKADKSRTRAAGGAGLGLTLCRRIAELHGGTLEITSAPGQGTTVCYRFDTTS